MSVTLANATTIEYLHDPQGRRIAKKVNGVIVEKYLWQGLTRLLAVYDGADNLVMRFQYADGRMPVAMTKGNITYYLGYDQIGSLRAVVDAAGNMVKQIAYDSFGNILSDSNPTFCMVLAKQGLVVVFRWMNGNPTNPGGLSHSLVSASVVSMSPTFCSR
ncbi:RHS repeat protein [Geothermobacter hydrogeniphilus]|uniref:RHS repeat protein n=1 Tax=Geothermobacter hydrogeniphilus TaxID=1969733 RepID=UPI0018ED6B8B